jgi:hypothetical protein
MASERNGEQAHVTVATEISRATEFAFDAVSGLALAGRSRGRRTERVAVCQR